MTNLTPSGIRSVLGVMNDSDLFYASSGYDKNDTIDYADSAPHTIYLLGVARGMEYALDEIVDPDDKKAIYSNDTEDRRLVDGDVLIEAIRRANKIAREDDPDDTGFHEGAESALELLEYLVAHHVIN